MGRVLITPRIGITKAADWPLRYVIAGNEFVSDLRSGTEQRRKFVNHNGQGRRMLSMSRVFPTTAATRRGRCQ